MNIESYGVCANSIINIAELSLQKRKNAGEVIKWMRENSTGTMPQLLRDFDMLIYSFNRSKKMDAFPDNFANARALRSQFPDRNLPSLNRLSNRDPHNNQLIETFAILNKMMMRGESAQEEPALRWLLGDADAEAKFIGGLYHGYEERLLIDPRQREGITRGMIVESLIEIASLEPDKPLWLKVADPDELNWVDRWDGFDVRFRKCWGLE